LRLAQVLAACRAAFSAAS